MIQKKDILKLPLEKREITAVIAKAKKHLAISKRDNLRQRHPNIQFDCILRGYIGEYAMQKWFSENGIRCEAVNRKMENDSVDIDFFYKKKNLELKTSLIPDSDGTIDNVILKRDIKLIKREEKVENLRGDVHLQIYFDQKRKAKDSWLKQQTIDLESEDIEYLYDAFLTKAFKRTTFFTAWIDKPSLVQKINKMPKDRRSWTFQGSKRQFWNCKIQAAKKPVELIGYLKKL